MPRLLHAPAILVLVALAAGAGRDVSPAVAPPPAPPTPTAKPSPAGPLDPVVPPPPRVREAFALDPRHARMVDADGLPVVGSERVPEAALREAAHVVRRMLAARPELLAPIVEARVRLVVMHPEEMTTDVPEHADLQPAAFWDRRARGLGATRSRPAVSCGAENLLEYAGDPHAGESVLVHEFAHAVHEIALALLDPSFDRRLTAAYEAAMAEGRWAGTYASTNRHEYFAEAVQAYFDTNRQDDREHGHVDTRAELAEHDPPLHALVDEAFGGNPWRHRPISERPEAAHLAGHDPASAPRFRWPDRVTRAWEQHQRSIAARLESLTLVPATPGAVPPASASAAAAADATSIRFVNRGRDAVRLVWIDTMGQARGFGWVRARGSHVQPTFSGHTWLLMDAAGDAIGWAVASPSAGRVEIAGPPEGVGEPAC